MRYSYEFKIKCVEMYERGEYPDTPNGVPYSRFIHNIRIWKRMVGFIRTSGETHDMANNVISYSPFSVVDRDIVTTFYITYDYFIWSILLYGEKRLCER